MRKDTWHKSSHSDTSSNCVEVNPTRNSILVRDSKYRDNNALLQFSHADWCAFVGNASSGGLDVDLRRR
jgi:Domain of unknown function (DUF397)